MKVVLEYELDDYDLRALALHLGKDRVLWRDVHVWLREVIEMEVAHLIAEMEITAEEEA